MRERRWVSVNASMNFRAAKRQREPFDFLRGYQLLKDCAWLLRDRKVPTADSALNTNTTAHLKTPCYEFSTNPIRTQVCDEISGA